MIEVLVVIFQINDKLVLIAGDNEFYSQKELCEKFFGYEWDGNAWRKAPLEVSVLKYPRHGVHDYPLFMYIKADIVVVSCGQDGLKWNVPKYVIEQYERAGSKVYWTGRDGDIEITL